MRPATKAVSVAVLLFSSMASGQGGGDRWLPTWVASPQQPRTPGPGGPAGFSGTFNNQTVRMIVHSSIGGRRVRVQLSNAYGSAPLVVGSLHVALRIKDSRIAPDTDRALMFNGMSSCTIPVGAFLISDPVDLEVPKQADLAVSVYVPGDSGVATAHSTGLHTTWISKSGNVTGKPEIADAVTTESWYWISGVEVLAPPAAASLVAFGDSITDGFRSTPNTDGSWPAFFATRLLTNPATTEIAVLNEGITGNRLLRDGAGVSALARFDRDVLSQAGAKWIMLLEGINDIGAGIGPDLVVGPKPATDIVTVDELAGAYKQIIERAHEHGIKVFGSPLLPFEGAVYYTDSGNATRLAINKWIRTSGAFDGLVDFEAAVRDTANPNRIRPEFDAGDHLHPNNAGYKAMAEAIDLSLFVSRGTAVSRSRTKR